MTMHALTRIEKKKNDDCLQCVQSVGEKIIIFQRSSVISFKQKMEKKFQLYKRRLLILYEIPGLI